MLVFLYKFIINAALSTTLNDTMVLQKKHNRDEKAIYESPLQAEAYFILMYCTSIYNVLQCILK